MRSRLFASLAQKDKYEVLPGRYGGEYNNDMLALGPRRAEGWEILLLGLKVTDGEGNVQLDMHSMGPLRQMSRQWLEAVVHALRMVPNGCQAADRIATALASNKLIPGLIILDRADGTTKLLRLSLDIESWPRSLGDTGTSCAWIRH